MCRTGIHIEYNIELSTSKSSMINQACCGCCMLLAGKRQPRTFAMGVMGPRPRCRWQKDGSQHQLEVLSHALTLQALLMVRESKLDVCWDVPLCVLQGQARQTAASGPQPAADAAPPSGPPQIGVILDEVMTTIQQTKVCQGAVCVSCENVAAVRVAGKFAYERNSCNSHVRLNTMVSPDLRDRRRL